MTMSGAASLGGLDPAGWKCDKHGEIKNGEPQCKDEEDEVEDEDEDDDEEEDDNYAFKHSHAVPRSKNRASGHAGGATSTIKPDR